MLADFLMNALLAVVESVWALVPTWTVTIPPEVGNMVGELSKWDAFVPFSEVMQVGQLVGSLVAAVVAWKVLNWVIKRILEILPTGG